MKTAEEFLRETHRKLSDIEWMTEFYEFLKGEVPEKIHIKAAHRPKLNSEQAQTVLWYLQEHFSIFPDNIEVCRDCDRLYDSNDEGHWYDKGGYGLCGSCMD